MSGGGLSRWGGGEERHKGPRPPPIHERPAHDDRQGRQPDEQRPGIDRVEMGADGVPFPHEIGGDGPHAEAEEVLHLTREDDERDAAREPDGDRVGDELDRAAQAHDAEDDEDHARHHGRGREPFDPVALYDGVDDHHEGPRRPADLDARPAQRRDQEPGDDRREEPALRRDAARDRERDRERQRHDADDDPRDRVREELLAGVTLERGDELRNEPVQIPCPVGAGENLTPAAAEAATQRTSPSRWSSENAPGPSAATARAAMISTRLYSKPPF